MGAPRRQAIQPGDSGKTVVTYEKRIHCKFRSKMYQPNTECMFVSPQNPYVETLFPKGWYLEVRALGGD